MTQRFRSLPEQVQALAVTQAQQSRALRVVEADARRSAQQAEGAIEDVRDLSDVVRILSKKIDDTKAAVLVVSGHQQEQLVVLNRMAEALEELRPTVASARTKASGAHKLAVQLEARLSDVEDDAREWAAAMAVAQAPIDVAERRALMADMYRAARPWAPRVVAATALLILAVLGLGAAAIHSCSGGF